MKLDRNNHNGMGKYALLKLRVLRDIFDRHDGRLPQSLGEALALLEQAGVVDYGYRGTESEFMVIRLKDKYAAEALEGYANEAGKDDPEYADDVRELADRAGPKSAWCKAPD